MCSFKLGGAFPLEARSKENRYYLSLKEEETSTRFIYLLIHLTPTRSEYLLCARPMTVTRKHGWVRISSFPPGHLWTKARRMRRSRREKRWPAQGPVAGEQQRWDEKEVSWSPSQSVVHRPFLWPLPFYIIPLSVQGLCTRLPPSHTWGKH